MRGADFPASPSFEHELAGRIGDRPARRAELSRARRALIDAATAPGEVIAVPANASRDLVDDVKACNRRHRFVPVDAVGVPVAHPASDVAAVWVQTIAGIVPPLPATTEPGPIHLIDAGDTVVAAPNPGVVTQQLPDEPTTIELLGEQIRRCGEVSNGLRQAAGLPLIEPPHGSAPGNGDTVTDGPIPTGVVVRLPAEADPITFVAYARAELTGIDWLPLRRPLHPQAHRHLDPDQLASSIDHLSRLLIVPVGPAMTDEEVGHAVLGITKTAEYTGWRWVTDLDQVRWYGQWLVERYGPDHEAYRPAFPITDT